MLSTVVIHSNRLFEVDRTSGVAKRGGGSRAMTSNSIQGKSYQRHKRGTNLIARYAIEF